ncbi:M15 family metallopeptidase [Aeromicrobium sp.]|uniref:M15 family metallopeptidase n=1 Tax=Aeromicrobium sp. TaxID=1871063 RepID=UPI002FCBEF14
MNHNESRPTSRAAVLAIGVVLAAMSAFYAYTSLTPSSATQTSPMTGMEGPPRDDGGPTDNGHIRGSVTVFDDSVSAIAHLDPDLLKALRSAATDAAADGIEFQVNSGWRSADYQNQLLRDAVSKYGSEREAARWVATPKTSPHVSGDAVDIGRNDAIAWLAQHGAAYGLCQIYGNEPWHFELRPDASKGGCLPTYADPTHDPRMR